MTELPPLTWLYVPGDRPDRFGKAVDSGADVVILDLEDAVAAPGKADARVAVAEFLATRHPVPVHVRIGSEADLAAVAGRPGLAGLRLPKVESPEQVRTVAAALADLPGTPHARAATPGPTAPPYPPAPTAASRPVELHCLIESAAGVEAAYRIATADPAVAGISLGEADLGADLNVSGEDGLAWVRSRIVVAARAAGLPPPAMSAHPHVTDLAGLAASCMVGRRLGFLGRAAIHPRQLPVIVEAFRPEPDEVERARVLLAGLARAERHGSGTVVLPDGRFADRAMAAAARRTVALAARCEDRGAPSQPADHDAAT